MKILEHIKYKKMVAVPINIYDLTKKLPNIFKFLAIPDGYKFNLNTEEIVQSNTNENS